MDSRCVLFGFLRILIRVSLTSHWILLGFPPPWNTIGFSLWVPTGLSPDARLVLLVFSLGYFSNFFGLSLDFPWAMLEPRARPPHSTREIADCAFYNVFGHIDTPKTNHFLVALAPPARPPPAHTGFSLDSRWMFIGFSFDSHRILIEFSLDSRWILLLLEISLDSHWIPPH